MEAAVATWVRIISDIGLVGFLLYLWYQNRLDREIDRQERRDLQEKLVASYEARIMSSEQNQKDMLKSINSLVRVADLLKEFKRHLLKAK